jgi:hypothetical protein
MNGLERFIRKKIGPFSESTYTGIPNPVSADIPGTTINFASHREGEAADIVGIESLRTEFNIFDDCVEAVIYSSVRDDEGLYIGAGLTSDGTFGVNVACFDKEGKTTKFFRPKVQDLWPLPALKAIKNQLEERTQIKAHTFRDYWFASYREVQNDKYSLALPYRTFIRDLEKLCDKQTITNELARQAAVNSKFHRIPQYLGFPVISQISLYYLPLDPDYMTPEAVRYFDKFGNFNNW